MSKKVKITDDNGNVDDNEAHVSKKDGVQITWLAGDSDGAIIVFSSPDGSPFLASKFYVPVGGSVSTGPAYNGEVGKQYKYIVVGDSGANDPVVVIDN